MAFAVFFGMLDWIQRAQILAWSDEVRRRTKWSNDRLDGEFAYLPDKPREGIRPRTFEKIFASQSMPKDGCAWRSTSQLIAAVEAHPDFRGTAIIFKSPIWTFWKLSDLDLVSLDKSIRKIARVLGFEREALRDVDSLAQIVNLDDQEKWERSIAIALSFFRKDVFGFRLTLIWLLHREADILKRFEHCQFLKNLYQIELENIALNTYQKLVVRRSFIKYAGEALVEARVKLAERETFYIPTDSQSLLIFTHPNFDLEFALASTSER